MSIDTNRIPKFCQKIDNFIRRTGEAASWINGILILVIILQVVLRYVFGVGMVILEELQWHLYAVGIMLGLSYCLVMDTHIRLDIAHEKFSPRTQEIIELLGTIFLLLPIIIIILIHSWPFLEESIRINERSDSPVGLPFRWIIKTFLPLGFSLLGLAAISRMIRSIHFLKNRSK
jgi:TRAP-type mannitol/chloroaromatic compound transport system permease small subunit|tara:strand:- start:182 stop:706 length:525 start_codon:yes stop_codon:yes gene_type:complete